MIRKLLLLLSCLTTLAVFGQQDSLPGIPCPGGRLVPMGFSGEVYQFVTDSLRIGRNAEGELQLLVQHYEGNGPAGTILHVFLDTGPIVEAPYLDSLVRRHHPGARYVSQPPFGISIGPQRIPCMLIRERNGKRDTLLTDNIPNGGDKVILAARMEGPRAAMFREAEATYPKQRLLLSLWLPPVPGVPFREYIHDLSATLSTLNKSNDQ